MTNGLALKGGAPRELHVAVVGAGVAGLSTLQALLDVAEARGTPLRVTWAVLREGTNTTSRSGGLVLQFSNVDKRTPWWTKRTGEILASLKVLHPDLAPSIVPVPTLLLSNFEQPEVPLGHLGDVEYVDPAGLGFPNFKSSAYLPEGIVIDTCTMLPIWIRKLSMDPRVSRVDLTTGFRDIEDVAAWTRSVGADVTVMCIGLGMRLMGDRSTVGLFGPLLDGPIVSGPHRNMTVMYEDEVASCAYSIPHLTPGHEHLHGGGAVIEVNVFDQPDEVREPDDFSYFDRYAKVQGAGALERIYDMFPTMTGWMPDHVWYGLRPFRHQVVAGALVPFDRTDGEQVMLNYGHGGSGWTVAFAIAEEIATRLVNSFEFDVRVDEGGSDGRVDGA